MRNFSKAKRVVIKIGTNILTKNDSVDSTYVRRISHQVSSLIDTGREVLIVSSGAIGMGAGQLGQLGRAKETKMRQACAAIGQPLLMTEYRRAFSRCGLNIAQVLLTAKVFDQRKSYLNLRNAVETLLKLGAVPIINENDSVSTEEIGTAFGDNDKLSALIASKVDADILIILSDIDALYNKDPKKYKDAKAIETVFEITKEIERYAGGSGSTHATGGMKTKIEAAKIASNAGCRLVLANGRIKNVIGRIMSGANIGTIFMPKRKLSNRLRWILHSNAVGTIKIDEGAQAAIRRRKSLLPSGIVSVRGNFEAGAVVLLNDMAKAVTALNSVELRKVAGKHSREIKNLLGAHFREEIAVPDDIALIDY